MISNSILFIYLCKKRELIFYGKRSDIEQYFIRLCNLWI